MIADLPTYTQDSLQDPLSPQRLAYDWLVDHQSLTDLEEWQQRQQFGIVATYYALGGGNGHWPPEYSDWLDDSISVCDWYSLVFQGDEDALDYEDSCDEQGRLEWFRLQDLTFTRGIFTLPTPRN